MNESFFKIPDHANVLSRKPSDSNPQIFQRDYSSKSNHGKPKRQASHWGAVQRVTDWLESSGGLYMPD